MRISLVSTRGSRIKDRASFSSSIPGANFASHSFSRDAAEVAIDRGARCAPLHALKTDILASFSSVEAFKQILLNARAVAYVPSGQSGVYFIGIVEKLGIADQIKAKAKTALGGGSAAELVAKGEADIAIQVTPELISAPGVEVVGPFPPELQTYIGLTRGVGVNARHKAASQSFVKYLTTPAAISVIKAKGMESG